MAQTRFLLSHPVMEKRVDNLGHPVEIPALPELYMRLREIVNSPTGNANRVAALLANEPGLSMKILRMVNAPTFGLRQQVTKVEQAVSLLGMDEIAGLVLSATLMRSFPPSPGHRCLDLRKFWEHSIGTGILARLLGGAAHRSTRISLDDTFVAGLIHDIGKLMLLQNYTEDFSRALDLCKSERSTLIKAEQRVFGFSHQDIGAYVADQWGFGRHLVKALELHNTPDDLDTGDSAYPFVALIHAADTLAHALRFGDSGDPFVPVFSGRAYDALAIDIKSLPLLLEQARTAFTEAKTLLN